MSTNAQLVSQSTSFKRRCLRLAEELFLARGIAGVTIDHLASNLRTSKRTIYEHFGSKLGLLESVVLEIDWRLEAALAEIAEDSATSVGERMLRIARFQASTSRDLGPRFLEELKSVAPGIWDVFERHRLDRVERYYRPLIDEGIRAGVFDPEFDRALLLEVYLQLSAMVTFTDLLENVMLSKEVALEQLIRLYLRGTARRGGVMPDGR